MDELLNNAPCGFLAFNDGGTILSVNATLLELLGYQGAAELEGRHVTTILAAGGRIFYQTHFFPLLMLHGKAAEVYLSLRSSTGEDLPVLANAVRRKREGSFVSDCIFFPMRQRSLYEDEILQAKKTAEEANRLKDEFLATVSHELRTPLTAMLGWVHMLRTGQLAANLAVHALEVIERNAEAQAQLIEDLLDVSRIISGKVLLDVQPIDPSTFIEAAVESVSPAADAKSVRLQKVLDTDIGTIFGDPVRLQQVVWNLLSNAIKFTPRGGSVQVRLERIDSHVEITVSDTGIGISPEFQPYVFDRFRQANQAANRQHGGLGLGLSIVRHLVELHGGEVRVYSPGVGGGSSFTVALPLMALHQPIEDIDSTPTRAGAGSSPPEDSHRLDGVRLLVVDDEADARELLETALGQCGAEVLTADSARRALELLSQQRPDVLISDIGMPNEDGYELIGRVRALPAELGGKTPAIALTAYARVEDRLRALQAGYQMHVPKPVVLAELVAVIFSLVERKALSESG